MDTEEDSVMIALLPTQWTETPRIELPHVTLAYAGKKDAWSPNDFSDMAKDVASLAMITPPFSAKVIRTAVFGEDPDKVDVMVLEPAPSLLALRNFLEKWDVSDYPTYRPHMTIGPARPINPLGSSDADYIPMSLMFDKLALVWGSSQISMWLRQAM